MNLTNFKVLFLGSKKEKKSLVKLDPNIVCLENTAKNQTLFCLMCILDGLRYVWGEIIDLSVHSQRKLKLSENLLKIGYLTSY